MALEARIVDVQREGDCVSLAAEFYDTADPSVVLFSSPRWAFDAGTSEDEIDDTIAAYGRTRDQAEEAALSLAGHTVQVIDRYEPSPERAEAVKAEAAAAEAAAAEAAAAETAAEAAPVAESAGG